ncbi:MAG: MlrC C-terminal domain-containing protein [Holdemania filiformis]
MYCPSRRETALESNSRVPCQRRAGRESGRIVGEGASGSTVGDGELHHHYGETLSVGTCTTITLDGTTIDVIIAEKAVSFAEDQQYTAAGLNLFDYDLIIVKQGYIYPRLKELAKFSVMSLTDGATNQRTEKIQYRTILRPMYPIDEI